MQGTTKQEPQAEWPQRGPGTATRWLAVLLLVVAAALVWVVMRDGRSPDSKQTSRTAAKPRPVVPAGNLADDERATIQLFQNVSPSVVHVTSIEIRRSRLSLNLYEIPQGTGSGFVWDTDGHVVTNYHVIQHGSGDAKVTLYDGTVYKAKVTGQAPDKDLAVLEIDAPKSALRPIPVGSSSQLQVGQTVLAIGNPFGLDQTLTTGVISGLGREIQSVTKRPIQDVIQTDAAINPGNSGGPLLDSSGRLIGVNTAIYSPSGAYAGIGFAVPVDTINRIVPQLIAHGRVVKPGLGIHIGTDQLAARLGVEGVPVIDVPADSAASKAGIEGISRGSGGRWILGDVIVGINGQKVKTSSDLFRALDHLKVGDEITLEIQREGDKRDVKVTLQALP